jgi:hypothetical protein
MGKIKVNWILAQQEYLASKEASLTDIAQKYGVSLSRVKKVSMINKWYETKERIWESARELAIKESGSSATEMIKRHTEAARYFQETGLRLLKRYLKTVKEDEVRISTMLKILILGLKTERELYADELKNYVSKTTDETNYEGFSKAATEAINESFQNPFPLRKSPC